MLIIQRNWTVFHSIILDYIRYLSSYFHLPPIKRNEKKRKRKRKGEPSLAIIADIYEQKTH